MILLSNFMENKRDFTVQLTFDEFAKASFLSIRKIYLIPLLFISVGLLLFVYIFIEEQSLAWQPFFFLALGLFALIGTYFQIKKTWENNPYLAEATHQIFSESRISWSNSRSNGNLAWEEFKSWKELKDFILLFNTTQTFFIYPKRCFKSEAQLKDFKYILKQNLPEYSDKLFAKILRLTLLWVGLVIVLALGYLLFFAR